MYILEVMKKNTDLSVSYLTYPKSMKVACSANETTILVQYSLTFKVVYLLPMKYIYMNQLTRWNLFWSFQRILLFTTTVTSATISWLLKVCCLRHSLKFFLFDGNFLYHFWDTNFVVFLTILWNSKSVASR